MSSPTRPPQRPEDSILEVIGRSDLPDIAADAADALLRGVLNADILGRLPVAGDLLRLARMGIDMENYLFLKKLFRFMARLSDVPARKRAEFVMRLDSDPIFRERVAENLTLLLHRLDDMSKPELLARVFQAYVLGQIDYDTYDQVARALDLVRPALIPIVRRYYADPKSPAVDDQTMQALALCGLVTITPVKGMVVGPIEGYQRNRLGEFFFRLALSGSA